VISVSSIISNLVQIGQTEIIFPHEFHHSYPETRLGYIQPLLLRYEDEEIYYWPDVHGFHYQPDQDLFIQFLLKLIPSSKFQNSCHRSLILGGPPTSFFNNFNQATKIAQKFSPFFEFFDLILIDHHLFRENTWLNLWDQGLEKIQGNLSEKRKNKISIQSYYEFLQNSPFSNKIQNIAEANRNELYENDPLSPEYLLWGDRCRAGNVSEYPPIP
jgi:predicted metallo-beta-lactamase superfamily hydrolase